MTPLKKKILIGIFIAIILGTILFILFRPKPKCSTDSDCTTENLKKCSVDTHKCVTAECNDTSGNCSSSKICDNYKCKCKSPSVEDTDGSCYTPCTLDNQCTQKGMYRCNTSTGKCDAAVCNTISKTCTLPETCSTYECKCLPPNIVESGKCFTTCATDKDCTQQGMYKCDSIAKKCVVAECNTDANCSSDKKCLNYKCVCKYVDRDGTCMASRCVNTQNCTDTNATCDSNGNCTCKNFYEYSSTTDECVLKKGYDTIQKLGFKSQKDLPFDGNSGDVTPLGVVYIGVLYNKNKQWLKVDSDKGIVSPSKLSSDGLIDYLNLYDFAYGPTFTLFWSNQMSNMNYSNSAHNPNFPYAGKFDNSLCGPTLRDLITENNTSCPLFSSMPNKPGKNAPYFYEDTNGDQDETVMNYLNNLLNTQAIYLNNILSLAIDDKYVYIVFQYSWSTKPYSTETPTDSGLGLSYFCTKIFDYTRTNTPANWFLTAPAVNMVVFNAANMQPTKFTQTNTDKDQSNTNPIIWGYQDVQINNTYFFCGYNSFIVKRDTYTLNKSDPIAAFTSQYPRFVHMYDKTQIDIIQGKPFTTYDGKSYAGSITVNNAGEFYTNTTGTGINDYKYEPNVVVKKNYIRIFRLQDNPADDNNYSLYCVNNDNFFYCNITKDAYECTVNFYYYDLTNPSSQKISLKTINGITPDTSLNDAKKKIIKIKCDTQYLYVSYVTIDKFITSQFINIYLINNVDNTLEYARNITMPNILNGKLTTQFNDNSTIDINSDYLAALKQIHKQYMPFQPMIAYTAP